MFEQFQKPMIFAHRGACAFAPENTLPSFELAVAHHADAVELDAKLSRDEVVMVIHDQTVDRTTDGIGKVNALSLGELKAFDAGSFFCQEFTGVKIPTLDEVFEAVGQKVLVNVELTNYKSKQDALVERVAAVVKRHKMEERVVFSSFLPINLVKSMALLPTTPVALLCLPGLMGIISRSKLSRHFSPQIVHPYLSDVNLRYIEREHKSGRRVHVWTVNNEADILRLKTCGVDGLFTDNPLNTKNVLEKK
jgi:glycerophosphoryl diester phosphodiesterase